MAKLRALLAWRALCLLALTSVSLSGWAQGRALWGGKQRNVRYEGTKLRIESDDAEGFRLDIQSCYFLDASGLIPLAGTKMLESDKEGALTMPRDINFHKLRTTFSGQLSHHWGFQFELDYGQQRLRYLSMQLDYQMNQHNLLRIGNMKVPSSMSVNHSAHSLMQLDTPIGLSLASHRRMGLGYFHHSRSLYIGIGGYTYNMNTLLHEQLQTTPEWLVAARIAYSPLVTARQRLLLGINASYYRPKEQTPQLTIRPKMESSMADLRFLQLNIPLPGYQANYGGELAYQAGRLLLYGEVLASTIDASSLLHFATFLGWQGTLSYVLLGSPRGYNRAAGDFSGSPYRLSEKGLEIGLRASGLSLNLAGEERIQGGGALVSYSAFISYWISRHLALTLQGTYLDHDTQALGAGRYTVPKRKLQSFDGADLISLRACLAITF